MKTTIAAIVVHTIFSLQFPFFLSEQDNSETPRPKYTIISDEKTGTIKRMVDVRLGAPTTETHITELANEIVGGTNFDRTFINYYLPGMKTGAGAYATSHFNPDLKVRLLGLTSIEIKKLEASERRKNEIGRWLYFQFKHLAVIFRDGDNYFMEKTYPDGSSNVKELTRSDNKFTENGLEQYFIINSRGDLEFRDDEGDIETGKASGSVRLPGKLEHLKVTRKWTDKSGKFSIDAKLIDFQKGKAHLLKKDGTIAKVLLSQLDDQSRKSVVEFINARKSKK